MKYLILLFLPFTANAADVNFTWTDTNPPGTEYNLYCDGQKVNPIPITERTIIHPMTDGVPHACNVTAIINEFESAPSDTGNFTIPFSPTGFSATVIINLTQ